MQEATDFVVQYDILTIVLCVVLQNVVLTVFCVINLWGTVRGVWGGGDVNVFKLLANLGS
jgi:hypothetical protein